MKKGLSGVVFGSTGAVGKAVVSAMLDSQKWERVHCVVRKEPEEWANINKPKLTVQV